MNVDLLIAQVTLEQKKAWRLWTINWSVSKPHMPTTLLSSPNQL